MQQAPLPRERQWQELLSGSFTKDGKTRNPGLDAQPTNSMAGLHYFQLSSCVQFLPLTQANDLGAAIRPLMIESRRTESRDDIIHEEWANLTSQGSVLATCTSAMKGLHPHACLPLMVHPAKGRKKRARPFPNLQCKHLLSCISSFSPCNWSTWEQMLSRYLWMDQVRSAT